MDSKPAALVLEDGVCVVGTGFGAEGEAAGEVVFNTSMTGYQEALTDPSYKYQILMPTYPLIGNYGFIPGQSESDHIQVEGFVVRELTDKPSHGQMTKLLNDFLVEEGVPGLQGVDTRYLTRKIRTHGVMNGILKHPFDVSELEDLKTKASKLASISDMDLIEKVTSKAPVVQDNGGSKKVVVVDCGCKRNIVKSLLDRGINTVTVPADYTADQILEYSPNGVVFSNGPGDPERPVYVIESARKIIDETNTSVMGICLGLQIIGLACGAEKRKLKFGHRGSNQPVMDLKTRKVYITSQNHGFDISEESCKQTNLEVTHINLNDRSVEGIQHKEKPVFAVQYHPEAHPGPWDNFYLFNEYIKTL